MKDEYAMGRPTIYGQKEDPRTRMSLVTTSSKLQALQQLRIQHGLLPGSNVQRWSRKKIVELASRLSADGVLSVKTAPVLNLLKERFRWCNYDWEVVKTEFKNSETGETFTKLTPRHKNLPTLEGRTVTLYDLVIAKLEWIDGYDSALASPEAECLNVVRIV